MHFQNQDREPKLGIWVGKTIEHIQTNIGMQNPSQEPAVSSKAQYQDLKNIDDLCTLKINIESQNSE